MISTKWFTRYLVGHQFLNKTKKMLIFKHSFLYYRSQSPQSEFLIVLPLLSLKQKNTSNTYLYHAYYLHAWFTLRFLIKKWPKKCNTELGFRTDVYNGVFFKLPSDFRLLQYQLRYTIQCERSNLLRILSWVHLTVTSLHAI